MDITIKYFASILNDFIRKRLKDIRSLCSTFYLAVKYARVLT